ncbi:hypothetical protein SEA_VINCENZO_81 [Mycobacterium phage Vincenzo]|uniref:Uncharacterized protein n=2 Tax=Coopervirus vincenzo TaxID=1983110 RepID=A0A0F6YQ66_9CAUD|nr:hypothetical protein SEA_VINCENZO_81 [Mycobacterium phage Vincenzo]AKF14343.1 hypothetical protein SEA_VINCENZO_81 [Mycobacterium phage Vincenzo]AKF14747.1 hypothetical protein SEA_ALANGRANT_82 [Mycobacterium phage AlanGrant]
MTRTKGAAQKSPWCPGSGQPMAGTFDRCEYCGRTTNTQHRPIIDPRTGLARRHVALSCRQLRGQDAHRGRGKP